MLDSVKRKPRVFTGLEPSVNDYNTARNLCLQYKEMRTLERRLLWIREYSTYSSACIYTSLILEFLPYSWKMKTVLVSECPCLTHSCIISSQLTHFPKEPLTDIVTFEMEICKKSLLNSRQKPYRRFLDLTTKYSWHNKLPYRGLNCIINKAFSPSYRNIDVSHNFPYSFLQDTTDVIETL